MTGLVIEQGPAGFSLELHIIPPAHRKCYSFSISMVFHWSVKSSQDLLLHWRTRYCTGGLVRNRNQTGLGGARNTLLSRKIGKKWVSRTATSCPMFYLFSGSPRVELSIAALSPQGWTAAKNRAHGSLGCCMSQQWSHRVQISSSILPDPNDSKETR